jgi:hypothetical protein
MPTPRLRRGRLPNEVGARFKHFLVPGSDVLLLAGNLAEIAQDQVSYRRFARRGVQVFPVSLKSE